MEKLFQRSEQQVKLFKYDALKAGEIRLLRLHPFKSSSRAPSGDLITAHFAGSRQLSIDSLRGAFHTSGAASLLIVLCR
jgi:hypothetical protein